MFLPSCNSLRTGAFALAAFAAIAVGGANAQVVKATAPTDSVPAGQCGAFFHYIVDEIKAFPNDLSKKFVGTTLRFKRAGCAATDQDGPIFIITETNQDAISLSTALTRMGKFDIIGASGVKGCHRPNGNTCPVTTGTAASPAAGG